MVVICLRKLLTIQKILVENGTGSSISHSGYTRVSTHTLETLGNGNPHFGFFVGPEAGAGLVHLKI